MLRIYHLKCKIICLPEAFRLSPSSEVFYLKKGVGDKNVKNTIKSYMNWNSLKTDYALFGPMLSNPLRLDKWACLVVCEMYTLRDKHNMQKVKKKNIIPIISTVPIYVMYTVP